SDPPVLAAIRSAFRTRSRRKRRWGSGRAHEVGDDAGQLLAVVLLEEVAGALDGRVGLTLRARDELLEDAVGATGDRVAVAERAQERPVPLREHLPRGPVRFRRRVVRARR